MSYELTHQSIIEGCKRGDQQAQFKLYKSYAKSMYNVCLRMVGNAADAEDLLQNSFIDVFRKLHSFRYEAAIGAWMKRIVVNNCINFLRKRKVHFQELEDRHTNIIEEPSFHSTELDVKPIHEAIQQLPDGYRVVLSLYLLEGYDHKEISEILNVSESTSKSQYSRARRRLKEILKRQDYGDVSSINKR